MRAHALTIACLLVAGGASAQSIEHVVENGNGNGSIVTLTCAQCPPAENRKTVTYVVPELAAGGEAVEFRQIGGQIKLVRTEAYSGGSPVVFISKASDEAIRAARADIPLAHDVASVATAPEMLADAKPSIDTLSKTGSLETAAMGGIDPAPARSQEIDVRNFELRLK